LAIDYPLTAHPPSSSLYPRGVRSCIRFRDAKCNRQFAAGNFWKVPAFHLSLPNFTIGAVGNMKK
jgi:hypothetical protein